MRVLCIVLVAASWVVTFENVITDCEELGIIVLAAAVADVERSRSSGTSRSRSDAETSSDGRRQHEERFRRLLVCVTRLPTDDDACQSAPVLSAELVHCRYCCKCN